MAQSVLSETTYVRAVPTARVAVSAGWGYLPLLSLTWAAGLLAIAIADLAARRVETWAQPLFWVGFLCLLVPITLRLVAQATPRHERIALVVMLGLGMYLIKVFQSPVSFTLHDELIHWQTADDILTSGRLFHENSQIPVSSLYPGLHIVTTALMNLTGLELFPAGVIVLAAARLLLILGLFLLYEQVSGSSRIAGIGALIYMGNSNFVFFMSQFAYESLALPLAVFVLCAAVARARGRTHRHVTGLTLVVILAAAATAVTHHLTAFALVGFLIIWPALVIIWRIVSPFVRWFFHGFLVDRLEKNRLLRSIIDWLRAVNGTVYGRQPGYGLLAIITLAISVGWMVYVATPTLGYLGPVFRDGINDLVGFIMGEAGGRQLFQASSGQVTPLWEQLTSVASVALIVLWIPIGLLQFWKRFRDNPLAFSLAIAALAYPVTLAFRLTSHGWEISNRASEFLFVGIAFVMAVGIRRIWASAVANVTWAAVSTVCICVICLGGFMSGWPSWARLPGPYLVEADARSVEPEGVNAAMWAESHLGPDNRMAADRTNALLMGAYGNQRIVTGVKDGVFVGGVYFSLAFGDNDQELLQRGQVRYLVVDTRMSTALPMFGVYTESGEPGSGAHKQPIPLQALTKFDRLPAINRVFDSGEIAIYDVRTLSDAP